MARMHSRKKGKSAARKPTQEKPAWTTYSNEQVEKLVVKYKKAGKSTSEIGMILRDSYGIASVKAVTGKKVGAIVSEKGLATELPEDMLNLISKLIDIKTHREKNNQDMTAKRGDELTTSKLRRLVKYYVESKKLPADFKLDFKRLKMYLE